VVLFRRRFMRRDAKGRTSSPGSEPVEGVLLWIERVDGSEASKGGAFIETLPPQIAFPTSRVGP
jgi:hypothetical protein